MPKVNREPLCELTFWAVVHFPSRDDAARWLVALRTKGDGWTYSGSLELGPSPSLPGPAYAVWGSYVAGGASVLDILVTLIRSPVLVTELYVSRPVGKVLL